MLEIPRVVVCGSRASRFVCRETMRRAGRCVATRCAWQQGWALRRAGRCGYVWMWGLGWALSEASSFEEVAEALGDEEGWQVRHCVPMHWGGDAAD